MQLMPFRMACYLYDAVMLYANALSELLHASNDTVFEDVINDGRKIINQIISNNKYESEFERKYSF